jgi:hypothetical protein
VAILRNLLSSTRSIFLIAFSNQHAPFDQVWQTRLGGTFGTGVPQCAHDSLPSIPLCVTLVIPTY